MPSTRNGKPVDGQPKKKTARRTTSAKRKTPPKAEPQQAVVGALPPVPPPEDNDDKGKKALSMVERLRLAERLVAARMKPKPDSWPTIAKREGLPARTCQYVFSQYQSDMRKLSDNTGQPILAESLMLYTSSIEKLANEAEHGDTSAARVGAIRTMLDALKGRIELLAVLGRMPRSFRALDELVALQQFVRRLAEIVEEHSMPPEVVQEFVDLAREIQPIIEGTAVPALPPGS